MKIFAQAVRAVIIESLGVVMVVGMLFGTAEWSWERDDPEETTATGVIADAFRYTAQRLAWTDPPVRDSQTVADRLEYYGQRYEREATGYMRRVVARLSAPPEETAHEGRRGERAGTVFWSD